MDNESCTPVLYILEDSREPDSTKPMFKKFFDNFRWNSFKGSIFIWDSDEKLWLKPLCKSLEM
jgi:hypothetical protein